MPVYALSACCRVFFEAGIILITIDFPPHSRPPYIPPGTEAHCRDWNWNATCFYSPLIRFAAVALSLFTALYALLYELRMMLTYWQLESQPFKATRAVRVLWCVQVRLSHVRFYPCLHPHVQLKSTLLCMCSTAPWYQQCKQS